MRERENKFSEVAKFNGNMGFFCLGCIYRLGLPYWTFPGSISLIRAAKIEK
jgi:hypothetical protein